MTKVFWSGLVQACIFGAIIGAAVDFCSPAHAATTYTQAEVCLDSPAIKAGSSFSTCKKVGCGPKYNTDLVRNQDPAQGGAQNWQPWATIAASTLVVGCQNGSVVSVWTAKSTIIANPSAPPNTTPPPPPKVGKYTLTWQAPTQNSDNTAIPATTKLTYNVSHGSSLTGPWDTPVTGVTALTYTYNSLPITIAQCFSVSATATDSGSTATSAAAVVCAPANSVPVQLSTPGGVGGLKVTIDATVQR